MPVKGQFIACVCVLLDRPVVLDQIAAALAEWNIIKRVEASQMWCFSGPSVVLPYRPEVNGYVAVDVVEHPWPDGMGDPQSDPMLFGAWSMGQFGPFAFPGGLARAAQQCWSWPEGRDVVQQHRGFIRLRISYVFGGNKDAPILPDDYDPVAEVDFLTRAAASLFAIPGVLCLFNPNGEVLADRTTVENGLAWAREKSMLALDLWTQVRLFNVDADWKLMDTVGNSQFDSLQLPEPFPDLEACFRSKIDPNEVAGFLRNGVLYLLRNGLVLRDSDTTEGPGGLWRIYKRRRGLIAPPRAVLRFFRDGENPPEVLAADHANPLG